MMLKSDIKVNGTNLSRIILGTHAFGGLLPEDGLNNFPIISTTKEAHLKDVLSNSEVILSQEEAEYVLGERFLRHV